MPGEEPKMKRRTARVLGAASALVLVLGIPSAARPADGLPDYMRIDLKRLEETWHILDRFADKIWPGWKGYVAGSFPSARTGRSKWSTST
jgi:hypothetical protein